MFIFDHTLIMV